MTREALNNTKRLYFVWITFILMACGGGLKPTTGTFTPPTPPAALDSTFNSKGYTTFSVLESAKEDVGVAVLVNASNQIYVIGYTVNTLGNKDLVLIRYKSDGTLDTDFQSQGYVTQSAGAGGTNKDEIPFDADFDSSGNIIIVGSSYNSSGNKDMTLWRFTSAGVLDTNFDSDGIQFHNGAAGFSNSNDEGYDLYVDSSDNIYVTGVSTNSNGDQDMALWKYSSAGSLTSFASSGYTTHGGCAGGSQKDEMGQGIYVDSSSNVFVVGSGLNTNDNYDVCLWKYDSSGNLVSGFGSSGIKTLSDVLGGTQRKDQGYDIVLDTSDEIYITGQSEDSIGDLAIFITKIKNSDGTTDTSFGTNGWTLINNPSGNNYARDLPQTLIRDSSNNLYLVGSTTNTYSQTDILVAKLTSAGALDTHFNSTGLAVHDSPTEKYSHDEGYGISLDPSNKILVTGKSSTGVDYDIFVSRYSN